MKIRLRLVYAGGDAAATLLRYRRWSYTFVALVYPYYIKSDVQLIYVQLNVNDRRTQVIVLELAIMNTILIMLNDGGPGKTESEGQKVLGPSMIIRRHTATMWALCPTNKSNEHGRWLFILRLHENGTAQNCELV